MIRYAIKRIFLAMLIIVLAITVLFCMIFLVPGDPASIALGPRATTAIKEAFRISMGLDQPIFIQLLRFFGNVLRGDLGVDIWSQRSVTQIVFEVLPHTLALIFLGLGWPILIGIPMGCFAAVKRNGIADKVMGIISVSMIAVPTFVVAIYSLLVFAVALRWFPAIGAGDSDSVLSQLYYLVLPSFAIGIGWVGYIARIVRASMLEVLGENYIRTARAYGLPEHVIIFHHALKVAIIPTVALLGVGLGSLLSGAVFIEIVFARPGIGKLIFDAVITRNYPVVMGSVMISTIFLVTSTLIADLLNAVLDPRIRDNL
jgi:peptide/nickel transport system permease protein